MIITNIQRMSIDDGPGIRTTVFVKGCSLRCRWCHNPECMDVNEDASFFFKFKKAFQFQKVEELCDILQRDQMLYKSTGGGVTISGGEPLLYPEFVRTVGENLRDREIDLAIDTCGNVSWENIEMVLPVVKLFLYDLKTSDTIKHRQLTGVGNEFIWENFYKLLAVGKEIYIRIPVIGGANNEELSKIAERIPYSPMIRRVEFLPYHRYGIPKYAKLGIGYSGEEFYTPDLRCCQTAIHILQQRNLKCYFQGDELYEREEKRIL